MSDGFRRAANPNDAGRDNVFGRTSRTGPESSASGAVTGGHAPDLPPMSRIHYEGHGVQLHHGDCLDVLATLPDASVDSVVTDPPYGLEFMGKEWDAPWEADEHVGKRWQSGVAEVRMADGATRLPRPSFEKASNVRCRNCERWRVSSNPCRCATPDFPNVKAANMRAFQAWCEAWATECLRVLKPGGHLLAFGGSRTYHRLTSGVEDAGFEIRDCITWHFGSGFPKSLDVSKVIDRARNEDREPRVKVTSWVADECARRGWSRPRLCEAFGVTNQPIQSWTERNPAYAVIPTWENWQRLKALVGFGDDMDAEVWRLNGRKGTLGAAWDEREVLGYVDDRRGDGTVIGLNHSGELNRATSDDAQRWQGWGTALKPATEFIVVARKPLTGTVAATVLEWGTGALNIAACRVSASDPPRTDVQREATRAGEASADRRYTDQGGTNFAPMPGVRGGSPAGRWPANVVFDEHQAAVLDEMSGESVSKAGGHRGENNMGNGVTLEGGKGIPYFDRGGHDDVGGASRFFYVAKADASERPRVKRKGGSDNATSYGQMRTRECNVCGNRTNPAGGQQSGKPWPMCGHDDWSWVEQQSARDEYVAHPTVKPLTLMRWLVRLVTPPGGTCLDPFAGSGTTVEACIVEGFKCIAVEKTDEYLPLVMARIHRRRDPVQAIRLGGGDMGLFDLMEEEPVKPSSGRWPANAIFSTSQADVLDEMSGEVGGSMRGDDGGVSESVAMSGGLMPNRAAGYGDSGGASRFFVVIPEEET